MDCLSPTLFVLSLMQKYRFLSSSRRLKAKREGCNERAGYTLINLIGQPQRKHRQRPPRSSNKLLPVSQANYREWVTRCLTPTCDHMVHTSAARLRSARGYKWCSRSLYSHQFNSFSHPVNISIQIIKLFTAPISNKITTQ